MEDSPSSHPRLAADPLLRRGDRGLGSERGQEAASRYPAPGRAVPGRLPQGRSEPRGSTVTARGWEAGSLSSHPRSAAIQTPPGPSPPRTSPGRELQEDGAQFPQAPGFALGPQQLRPLRTGRERRGARGGGASGSPGPAVRLQVSIGERLCNSQRSRSRGRLGKQVEPINKATWPPGWGGRAKSRRLFRQQRAAAGSPG